VSVGNADSRPMLLMGPKCRSTHFFCVERWKQAWST